MSESQLGATLHLGKGGVTEAWLVELRDQVKRRKVVKVKMLRPARGDAAAKIVAADIAAQADVRLVEVRGHTAAFGEVRPARPDR